MTAWELTWRGQPIRIDGPQVAWHTIAETLTDKLVHEIDFAGPHPDQLDVGQGTTIRLDVGRLGQPRTLAYPIRRVS